MKERLAAIVAFAIAAAAALYLLWPSAGPPVRPLVLTPPSPVGSGPAGPTGGASPPLSPAQSAVDAEPQTDSERRAWYDAEAATIRAAQRDCGVGAVDLACEGDHCAWRGAGEVGHVEEVREHLRQPLRLVFGAVAWAGVIAPEETPCQRALDAMWGGTVMPAVRRDAPARGLPYCGVKVRPGVARDPAVAGRICNALAVGRRGPEGAIFAE